MADLAGRLRLPRVGLGATRQPHNRRPRHSEAQHMPEALYKAVGGSHHRPHNVPRCQRRMGSGA